MNLSHPELLIPVLCLVGLLVLGVNGLLWLAHRNQVMRGEGRWFAKASWKARRPWQEEDEDLDELTRQVERLKERKPPEDGQK